MDVQIKKLEELSSAELLKIMAARIAVFVVEQQCPYQEIDSDDETAWHVWLQEGTDIAGYSRIIDKGDCISIGRILTTKNYRGQGYGNLLMEKTLTEIKKRYTNLSVVLSAQEYAVAFYQSFGFEVVSEVYLEDDIPHVNMKMEK
ncbi:GNAT family N-acetyltransferase [Enterococcus sp. CWB-B31]|uniref:GNAT family N-acetyltransferase n=1 Tax=Enterococcus sp. CWB-B31 TaxID=2885159 RepID=UPI001E64E5EE|nr:GNAT family N-acetyltransferase [Enterococcus sp. CWB-B31]MCB5956083.1 GNAT family N-acetyltransferase [Enterococcus sp. CWB-B31]